MDEENRRLAKQIREARKARGWTQPQLAEQAGVSLRMIQDAESGNRRPQAAKLDAIRRVLDLDATADETRATWDGYSTAAADLVGQTMHTFTPDERRQLFIDLTNWMFEKRTEILAARNRDV